MTSTVPHQRRAYDHRLREQVCRAGARALVHRLHIPRSTIATWKQRGMRPVITVDAFEHDRQELLASVDKLERRVRVLAAALRLVLALLRISGFRLPDKRLPDGADKATLLRTISSARPALPLSLILRILGLPASRYHAWRRADKVCGLEDRSSCPRTTPNQLTTAEVAAIKNMVLDPEHRHMPQRTLALCPTHRQGFRLHLHLG